MLKFNHMIHVFTVVCDKSTLHKNYSYPMIWMDLVQSMHSTIRTNRAASAREFYFSAALTYSDCLEYDTVLAYSRLWWKQCAPQLDNRALWWHRAETQTNNQNYCYCNLNFISGKKSLTIGVIVRLRLRLITFRNFIFCKWFMASTGWLFSYASK